MKKLLLVLAVMFSATSFAQLNVVKKEPQEKIGVVKNLFDTSLEATKRGDTYTIMYRDIEFQQIVEFKSFSLNEQAFHELYDLIISNWDNPPKEDIMIDLDKGFLWLHYQKALGTTSLQFVHSPVESGGVFGHSQYLTRRQVDKLFGK